VADYDVNDVASVGYIGDIPGWQLPPEAWTFAENVRIQNDNVGVGASWSSIIDTSIVDNASPWIIQAIRTPDNQQWLTYASLSDIYGFDGINIANISGPSAPYGTAFGYEWVITQLSGVPIYTNNRKPPQYWTSLSLSSDCADLPDWTASLGNAATCRSIRAFGPYLVALNVTLGVGGAANVVGTPEATAVVAHPHGVIWSHPADPGHMPASWNFADPTKDAGFNELNDADAGVIVDGLPLRSNFYIYKENATWVMRLVGGQYVMQFDPFLLQSGIMAAHCAALTGDGKFHFVATADDVIIHDGVSAKSLLDQRTRRTLFNRIDVSGYRMCHVFAVPSQREMWFAYPESGASQITRALVWNYSGGGDGVLYESVFPYPSAAVSEVAVAGTAWDAAVGAWDDETDIWDANARRQTVIADPYGKQVLQMDLSLRRDSVPFMVTLRREGLSFLGKRRGGEPLVDFKQRKFIRRIWPKMTNAPCQIRVGYTDTVDGATLWSSAVNFDPATQVYADFISSGREAPSVEFSWNSADGLGKLYGYKLEVFPAGRF